MYWINDGMIFLCMYTYTISSQSKSWIFNFSIFSGRRVDLINTLRKVFGRKIKFKKNGKLH